MVFLGDPSVGKTCLVHVIVHGKVEPDDTRSTIGFDLQQKEIRVKGIPMSVSTLILVQYSVLRKLVCHKHGDSVSDVTVGCSLSASLVQAVILCHLFVICCFSCCVW